jgi:hypothetical protein
MVIRLGEFSPFGRMLTLDNFVGKLYKFRATSFSERVVYYVNLTTLATFWAIFHVHKNWVTPIMAYQRAEIFFVKKLSL